MVAKKATADEPAVKAKENNETKKSAAEKAIAAKKAEVKTEVKKTATAVKEAVQKTAGAKPVKAAAKKAATEVKTEVKKVAEAKPAKTAANKLKESKPVQTVKQKAETKKAKAKKTETPQTTCIFKAIEHGDLVSFKALVATQKNKHGKSGRTPLMVVNLIRSNPRMTDGSNYETKRVKGGKEIYDEMYRLLIEAKCNTNAMDDAGNTARDYNYGGILNQMLAD